MDPGVPPPRKQICCREDAANCVLERKRVPAPVETALGHTLFSQSGLAGKLLTGCGLRLIDSDVITHTLIGNRTGLLTRQPALQSAGFVKRHWGRPML